MRKNAAIFHGNLRTFFMPLREDPSIRICDLIRQIVVLNDMDVFLCTDNNDYYYDGVQYLDYSQTDCYRAPDNTMYYHKVDFRTHEESINFLSEVLSEFFWDHLIGMRIDVHSLDKKQIRESEKFKVLDSSGSGGCIPDRMLAQYLKLKRAFDMMTWYENSCGLEYDIILKDRFDNMHSIDPLDVRAYDYTKTDIFVPGFVNDAELIYDWCAFGKRRHMIPYLTMYDHIGFTLDRRIFKGECLDCGNVHCGGRSGCYCGGFVDYTEYTVSSEHHLHRMFNDKKIRYASSEYPMSPYRYR